MLTTYKFKLKPTLQQIQTLEQDRKNCLYVKNRMIGDREFTYHAQHILGDYCSLHNKKTYTVTALRSNLETKCLESGLQCSINRNASLGEPYKAKTLAKRSAYEMQSSFLPTLKELKPELKLTSAGALQNAVKQVDIAFSRFFKKQAKHPIYKKNNQIGINYSDTECKFDTENYALYLSSSIGWVKFYNSHQFWQGMKFSHFVVTQDADGWYISILVKDESLPSVKQKTEFKSVLGVDVGIKKIVSLSDEQVVKNPQFLKQSERRLAIRQRRLSRKKKKSQNRDKAKVAVARTHQKIRRKRENFQWKLAKRLASKADVVAFEDLNIQGMRARCKPKKDEVTGKYLKNNQKAKSQLNKAISDAAWYDLKLKTQHQASKLGGLVIDVPARFSSQECSKCGYVSKKNRDKEKFVCEECAHYADADVDAAVVIRNRAIEKLGMVSLSLVKRKVTPKPEITGSQQKRESLGLSDEPRNPQSKVEYVQLNLFDLKSEWETG
jgi:putative transposase